MSKLEIRDKRIQESNRNLKLAYLILAKDEYVDRSALTPEFAIGQYAMARFKFNTSARGSNCIVSASFKIQELQKQLNIQINVTCNINGEAKCFICPHHSPHEWSDFARMMAYGSVCYTDKCYAFSIIIDMCVDTSIPSPWTSLHGDDNFTDFHLGSEDGSVPVHRVVMASHSEVFKSMLLGQWKETATGCLEVKGVTQQTLQHLKEYMYLGSLPEHDELRPLLLIAKCYMMHGLEQACVDKLARTVTPETFQGILEFAVDNRLYVLISSMVKSTSATVVEASEAINKRKLEAVEE